MSFCPPGCVLALYVNQSCYPLFRKAWLLSSNGRWRLLYVRILDHMSTCNLLAYPLISCLELQVLLLHPSWLLFCSCDIGAWADVWRWCIVQPTVVIGVNHPPAFKRKSHQLRHGNWALDAALCTGLAAWLCACVFCCSCNIRVNQKQKENHQKLHLHNSIHLSWMVSQTVHNQN
jgi:hypothetical protein